MLVVGAIERAPKGKRGFGRARLAVVANAKSETLREFITANIAPGSVVISDALSSYPNALAGPEYEHDPINVKSSGLQAHQLLPGVHRLFSLSKRWLEGTHQGRVEADHLQSYLDEFTFRFNRRTARQRGLLLLRHAGGRTTRPALENRKMSRLSHCIDMDKPFMFRDRFEQPIFGLNVPNISDTFSVQTNWTF